VGRTNGKKEGQDRWVDAWRCAGGRRNIRGQW